MTWFPHNHTVLPFALHGHKSVTMRIIPAIDLKAGACVRLTKGDFNTAIVYESDPLKMAERFASAGAECLHVVDLDGARAGEMKQENLIVKLAGVSKLKLQAGGGIRNAKNIDQLFAAGVERVVIGSLAVKNPSLVKTWLAEYGASRIVFAFDIDFIDSEPEIRIFGWQSGSRQLLWDVLDAYDGTGLRHILCTDISRDGTNTGSNHGLYKEIRERWPKLELIASGGVNDMEDLDALQNIGVEGVVIGKALYEGRINLAEAMRRFGPVP